jgi:hypothetical protein
MTFSQRVLGTWQPQKVQAKKAPLVRGMGVMESADYMAHLS